MIALKNGTTILDPRFDRLPRFDKRSREFPVTATLGGLKPRDMFWICNRWLDQGREGACVGFGMAHAAIAEPIFAKHIDGQYAHDEIYWPSQRIDEWPGGSYPGAEPVYEGTSVLAGCKIMKQLRWIDSYRWAFGLEDLIIGVGHHGPAVIGVTWYDGMSKPDKDGLIHVAGKAVGGHCTLVNEVILKTCRFRIHQSWGKGFAIDGDCFITFEDMGHLLHQRGEAVFFERRQATVKGR